MKTLLPVFGLVVISLSAFAQGKAGFSNNSLHLAYYCPDADSGLSPLDASLAGQPVTAGPTPSGFIPAVDLYMGTASSSLALYSSATFSGSPIPGKWNPVNVQAS